MDSGVAARKLRAATGAPAGAGTGRGEDATRSAAGRPAGTGRSAGCQSACRGTRRHADRDAHEGDERMVVGNRRAEKRARRGQGFTHARRPVLRRVVRVGQARRGAGRRMPCRGSRRIPGARQRKRRGDGGPVGDGRHDQAAGPGVGRPAGVLRMVLAREHRPEPRPAQGSRLRDGGRSRPGRRRGCGERACRGSSGGGRPLAQRADGPARRGARGAREDHSPGDQEQQRRAEIRDHA